MSSNLDIKVIKPYTNKDVLRITSYGAVSDPSFSSQTSSNKNVYDSVNKQKSELIQQCIDNASLIFRKIDEAIEENKKLAENNCNEIVKTTADVKMDIFNSKKKFRNKNFSPLEVSCFKCITEYCTLQCIFETFFLYLFLILQTP